MNNIKALYITDLDGTLLNQNAQLSKETLSMLKPLTMKGLPLVLCTARSFVHTAPIAKALGCQYPMVCYSGGLIYDPVKEDIILSHRASKAQVNAMLNLSQDHGLSPFIYTMAEDMSEHVYYCAVNSDGVGQYLGDREKRNDYRFVYDVSFSKWQDKDCYYFSFMGEKDQLLSIMPFLASQPHLTLNLCESYYYANTWWLEIMQKDQSKGHALCYLKERYQADKAIAFGDTAGDIAMIKAADLGIAVANATEPLKQVADLVIESNASHSVARYIAFDFK